MRTGRRAPAGLALLAMLAAQPSAAAQLQKLETEHLRLVHAGAAESFLLPYLGRTFENSLRFQQRLFDFALKF